MATQVQFRRGTTAQNNSFTGALGEVTVDTDKDTLVVHDGGTAGGFEISRADASNLKFPDGSVGSPAISFASDTNTGIYRGGTDILKFVTAGTDAITIDASQDVTLAGSLNFANNEKALFGAGSDLQIYSDGTNSIIKDAGTGNLQIQADDFKVMNSAGTENVVFGVEDGLVRLFYNNATKFETTNTGIQVYGTVVSDGMSTNTAGTSNFIAGVNAGNSLASGSFYNVLVGDNAGTALTTGDGNIAIGYDALKTEDADGYNVAIGYRALQTLNRGGEGYTVSIGKDAGRLISTGVANTIIGSEAGDVLSVGNQNVALGYASLSSDTQGNYSTAIGSGALSGQNFTSPTDTYNTAVGFNAGNVIATGTNNTLVGGKAGDAFSDGSYNTAMGAFALSTDTRGLKGTAVGYAALSSQNLTSQVDTYNTALGYFTGANLTTGVQNTLIGGLAGDALTDADDNIAIGLLALSSDTQGSKTVAIGVGALQTQNFTSATDSYNTAVGFNAGLSVTTGIQNTLIGSLSGDANTTGGYNTAIGKGALGANTEGNYNNAFGTDALDANTSGSSNNAMGYRALTAFNGSYNTSLGHGAGQAQTSGDYNTYVGAFAGNDMTTGAKNTIIGAYQGNSGGLDIRTASNNIVLSDGDGTPRGHWSQSRWNFQSDTGSETVVRFVHGATPAPYGMFIHFNNASPDNNTQYFIRCEDSTQQRFQVWSDGDVQNHDNSYGAISDVKLKEQITDASSQWDDIKALTVRKYKMKSDVAEKGDSDAHWRLGLIAQEVETAGMNGLVKENPDLDAETNEDLGTTTKSIKYSILYMKAVKALQEAMTRIETLEAKVTALENA